MKKLYFIITCLLLSGIIYSQTGRIDLKYPVVVPSLRVGGITKLRLDSITQNVDTIKFWNSGSELVTNGAGIWTGTGIRLDTTLAKVTLNIDQVTNESKATMFNNSIFTGSVRFNDGLYPGLTDLVKQIGTVGSEWNRFYLGTNGFITWNNTISLQGDVGSLRLNGGDLVLSNNLLTTSNIGSSLGRVNYLYVDTINANYANITLDGYAPLNNPNFIGVVQVPAIWPTDSGLVDVGIINKPFRNIYMTDPGNISFGTGASITASDSVLLLHASKRIMSTAEFEAIEMNNPYVTGMIYPKTDGGATLGHPNFGWLRLHMDTTSAINWSRNNIILGEVGGYLRLENSPLLIDNNDLGIITQPVKKGWFTDLDVTNPITGNITGNAATVTGYTRNNGSITLSGGHAITTTTTGTTTVTLPTTGTLIGSATYQPDQAVVDGTNVHFLEGADTLYNPPPYDMRDDAATLFPTIQSAAGDTSNYTVPDKIGDIYIDTSAGKVYVSVAATRGGWRILNYILPLFFIVSFKRRRRK